MEPTIENEKWVKATKIIQKMREIVFVKTDKYEKYYGE